MLTDLEKLFHKSGSSFVKYEFPPAPAVPTELEEASSIWMNVDFMTQQEQLLQSLNESLPNNLENQQAFDSIMESVDRFKDSNRDVITQHEFHFIGGPGGTGKWALFRKLHAACRYKGVLITICAATSLAALLFDGATTAHSLFSYPVEDESDVDY
jgi:hypothetical protein